MFPSPVFHFISLSSRCAFVVPPSSIVDARSEAPAIKTQKTLPPLQHVSQTPMDQSEEKSAGQHKEPWNVLRSEEHTSELQSHSDLVCRLLLEKKKNKINKKSTNQ